MQDLRLLLDGERLPEALSATVTTAATAIIVVAAAAAAAAAAVAAGPLRLFWALLALRGSCRGGGSAVEGRCLQSRDDLLRRGLKQLRARRFQVSHMVSLVIAKFFEVAVGIGAQGDLGHADSFGAHHLEPDLASLPGPGHQNHVAA